MISNNVVCATSKASDQPAHARSLSLNYSIIVKLLTEHHLEFLSLRLGCRGSSESTLVKRSNCWKSHAVANLVFTSTLNYIYFFLIFCSTEKIQKEQLKISPDPFSFGLTYSWLRIIF